MNGAAPVRMPFTAVRMTPVPPSRGGKSLERLGTASPCTAFPTLSSPQSATRKGFR
jgi:hypothetical protein